MKYLALVVLLLLTRPAAAQDFTVTATAPDSGSVAVSLQATVSFTFSAPLDTTVRFSDPDLPVEFFAISPPDSVQIDRATVSADRTRLSFEVTHTDDTDFVWILTGAYDVDSTLLCRPHVLQYTTADEAGPYTVSGYITKYFVTKHAQACANADRLALLWNARPQDNGYVVSADLGTGSTYDPAFEITGVRPGIYVPAGIEVEDGKADPRLMWWGYQDAETGNFVDSLVVSDSSRSGIIFGVLGATSAEPAEVPGVAALLPSYPNPFNPQTTVRFRLERPARVRLAVYDVLGREVAVLREGWLPMGTHERVWNAAGRASGLYLIRLDAGGATLSRTALLVR